MSIRIVYPNPFTGAAAFVGGATEAYNAGRINSQTEQARAEYQAQALQNAYDSQLYSQIANAGVSLGTAAIFAPVLARSINPHQYTSPDLRTYSTNVAQGKLSDFQPGTTPQQVTLSSGNTFDVSAGPGSFYPAGGPGDVNTSIVQPTGDPSVGTLNTGIPSNIARGVIAANVLDRVLPGTAQLGQVPLQQYVSDRNAARNFDYDQRAADADLVRRRGFFDYTRAARNEDQYLQDYGVTPAQTRTIGAGIYNSSPPLLQSQIARQFGYDSPGAISSLPQAEQDQFYGSIGLRSVRMQRAQEAIANDVSAQQQEALVKNAAELQSAYEQGRIELSAPYEQQYRQEVLEPEADLRRAIVNGDIDGYDAEVPLQELASRKNRFWATIPPKAYQKETKPQDIANQMVVEHPKKKGTFGTLKLGRNGQREIQWDKPEAKTLEFRSPKERDAHFELHTQRDGDGNVTATFDPKSGAWKPVAAGGKSKDSVVEPPKLGDMVKMYQDFRKTKLDAWKDSGLNLPDDDPNYGRPVGDRPSEEEMQREFDAVMQGAMGTWQRIAIGTDQFDFTRRDIEGITKAKREAEAKAMQQAQMAERVRNARPEQLLQLGIDPRMSRFHPDNVRAEQQQTQSRPQPQQQYPTYRKGMTLKPGDRVNVKGAIYEMQSDNKLHKIQ